MRLPSFFSLVKKREVSKKQMVNDFKAGLAVSIISLPLAIALGISSGMTPQAGLITAIIGGLVVSLLSGSSIQIGGPTSAFVIVVYGIIHKYGVDGLVVSTIMGGIILIILGILKLGSVVKYMSYPIILGFISGIAAILATSEFQSFLGLKISGGSDSVISKWTQYFTHIGTLSITTTIIGIVSVLIIVFWARVPKIGKMIPSSLAGLIIVTVIVKLLGIHTATIGSAFGSITGTLPTIHIPSFSFGQMQNLIEPAVTIALLSAVSSLLAAVAGDEAAGIKHDSNTELMAEGFANIASVLFGGIPVSGVVARTTANVKNGGKTPIAGIIHAIILFIIMMVLMPLTEYIPLTTLAAILLVVAYKMVKWRVLASMLKCPKGDLLLFVITFMLTILFNLAIAVAVGMAVSAIIFMVRMSNHLQIAEVKLEEVNFGRERNTQFESKNVVVKELTGAMFFGSINIFDDAMKQLEYSHIDALIFRMRTINKLDLTSLNLLGSIERACKKANVKFVLTELSEENKKVINNLQGNNILVFDTLEEALEAEDKDS
ncbi:MAG: SulP family inorganic anion transporter [Sarcina sp.]